MSTHALVPLRGRAVPPCCPTRRAALRHLASGTSARRPGCLGAACRTPHPHLALQLVACGLVLLARISYTAVSHASRSRLRARALCVGAPAAAAARA